MTYQPEVELLFTADCPHWVQAYRTLADALSARGRGDQDIALTVVRDEAQAQALRFPGSPTFLVDRVDPFASPDAIVGLACRRCDTREGWRATPSLTQLTSALPR